MATRYGYKWWRRDAAKYVLTRAFTYNRHWTHKVYRVFGFVIMVLEVERCDKQ